MKRLDSLLIGLLAASAVVLGVSEVAGLWSPSNWLFLCYALAVAVIFIPGRGNTGRVIRLALIFLIFAGIPYGWEQWMSFRRSEPVHSCRSSNCPGLFPLYSPEG